jgi:hypothetical protein
MQQDTPKIETIIRVEDKDGKGPYTSYSEQLSFYDNHNDFDTYPLPEYETGIERCITFGVEKCGFLTMEQLHNWFNEEELQEMEELGLTIKTVRGTITAVGEKQVLFIPEE